MSNIIHVNSGMSGAPSLSNTLSSLIGVLTAGLQDGFGSVTVNTLTVAANVATATVSSGHQFAMIGSCGPVIRIAGASPSGLNGDWRINVTDSTHFTFATTGIADQTATGTITAKRAPAGFSVAFSGTNKAVFRADDVTGNRLFLRVDDGYTGYSRIVGYESMTDADTGTAAFPTDAQQSGGLYVYKATAANRAWTLFSDGRFLYFFCDATGGDGWSGGFAFGDMASYLSPDAYGALLCASSSSLGSFYLAHLNDTAATYLARASTQTGGSIAGSRKSIAATSGIGAGTQVYPGIGNDLQVWPVEVLEAYTRARGLMPGLWNPNHTLATLPAHGSVHENIIGLEGRTLRMQHMGAGRGLIDLTGPWR